MTSIPPSLAPFFQEYRLPDLDIYRDAHTVLSRTLVYGDRTEIRWLFSTYTPDYVRRWFLKYGDQSLSEPHRTFWRLILFE